jgi:hypothetical protein
MSDGDELVLDDFDGDGKVGGMLSDPIPRTHPLCRAADYLKVRKENDAHAPRDGARDWNYQRQIGYRYSITRYIHSWYLI